MSPLQELVPNDPDRPVRISLGDRVLAPVRRGAKIASLVLIAVMIGLPALQVFLREVIGSSFVGAEELTRFMLICLVFLMFPVVVASGANIRFEEAMQAMPAAATRWLFVLIGATGAVVLGIAAAAVVVATLRNLNNATPTLGIPYWVFFTAAFLGFLLAALECLLQVWKAVVREPLYVTSPEDAWGDDMLELEAALVGLSGPAGSDETHALQADPASHSEQQKR